MAYCLIPYTHILLTGLLSYNPSPDGSLFVPVTISDAPMAKCASAAASKTLDMDHP